MRHPRTLRIAAIPGDGIGPDVLSAAITVLRAVQKHIGGFRLEFEELTAGAACYRETGEDMSRRSFATACDADAILLGAIGLPSVRYADGTEISPHLRLRDELGLYGGIRPAKAYPNTPRKLLDERAAFIDLIVLRESTEGLFYSAAVHGRTTVIGDLEVRETLRITRATTEKLCDLAFRLARKRKSRGGKGRVTCVDKANVFGSMAFFRRIFAERAALFPDIDTAYAYIDACALDLIRKPWEADVLVMENMFGDIISDLTAGLTGGMGMAACGEIGDRHGLFQPAHGSAPDIAGQDEANPLAAILSAGLMLDWLGEVHGDQALIQGGRLIESSVGRGFTANLLRPVELKGEQGTAEVTHKLVSIATEMPMSSLTP